MNKNYENLTKVLIANAREEERTRCINIILEELGKTPPETSLHDGIFFRIIKTIGVKKILE